MSFWYCSNNMYNFIESLATISLILSKSLCFGSTRKLRKYYCNCTTCKYFKIRLTHVSVWRAKIKETYHPLLMESLVVHHHFSIVQYQNPQDRKMFFLLVQILPTDCIQQYLHEHLSIKVLTLSGWHLKIKKTHQFHLLKLKLLVA